MSRLLLKRGSNRQLAPHFTEKEFFSTSYDAPDSHVFYTELVEAAELIRTTFNVPVRITSTFRTERHERKICADEGIAFISNSQHMIGAAEDLQPITNSVEIMAQIAEEFDTRGDLFKKLRKIGITGFGLYNTFIHLDCRTNKGKQRDAYGFYAYWDNRKGVKKKPTTTKPNQTTKPKAAKALAS